MGSADDTLAVLLRDHYGLNAPVTVRLLSYLARLVSFDLGVSVQYNASVASLILERLPVTIILMGSAMMLAFLFGSVVGIVAARRVNRWPDTLVSTLGLIFYATPSFWFGLMGICCSRSSCDGCRPADWPTSAPLTRAFDITTTSSYISFCRPRRSR